MFVLSIVRITVSVYSFDADRPVLQMPVLNGRTFDGKFYKEHVLSKVKSSSKNIGLSPDLEAHAS